MEFLIVDSLDKRKPIAIVGKIKNEIAFYTSNKFIARVLRTIINKPELNFEQSEDNNIVLDVVTKDNDKYLQYVAYMLEPPLKRHSVGTATVRDIKGGLDKLWKIYIGSTVPQEMYRL